MILFFALIMGLDCESKPPHPKSILLGLQENNGHAIGYPNCKDGIQKFILDAKSNQVCVWCVPEKCWVTKAGKATCYSH